MAENTRPQPAAEPNDLGRYFVERVNAGDIDGLVALYEPDAVLTFPPGNLVVGHEEIRRVLGKFVAGVGRVEPGEQQPALVNGDLAITSTKTTSGAVTVEVARRQPDGYWLWALDQPNILD
jgi:ketosteroid isomerase-like protein